MANDLRPMREKHIPPYKVVMKSLIDHHGSITKACTKIGISRNTYQRLVDDDCLSVGIARKIMNGYTEMKNLQRSIA